MLTDLDLEECGANLPAARCLPAGEARAVFDAAIKAKPEQSRAGLLPPRARIDWVGAWRHASAERTEEAVESGWELVGLLTARGLEDDVMANDAAAAGVGRVPVVDEFGEVVARVLMGDDEAVDGVLRRWGLRTKEELAEQRRERAVVRSFDDARRRRWTTGRIAA